MAVVALGTGCTAASPPAGSPPPAVAPTASPAASAGRDLTRPGAAVAMVDELLRASGEERAIMVTVTATDAAVTVLHSGAAQTWAWRDERIQQIPSDVTYVSQREFSPSDFALDDVGALFRAAESLSGSRRGQTLQIVDYSAGLVSMSVSTNPETRAVFFRPDGTVLPTLDFTSAWGLREGYDDVVGPRGTALGLGFGSAAGVYLDSPPDHEGVVLRRHRTARTPVLVTPRQEPASLRPFDPARVRPDVVWDVLERLRAQGRFTYDMTWSCVAEDRTGSGTPRLYFTVGDRSFATDLAGATLP